MKRSSEAVLPRDFLVSMPVSFLRTFVAPASNVYRRRIPITINSVLTNSIPFSSIVLLVLYLAFFPPLRCDNEHSLDSLNIPEDHIPYFLNSHPHLKARYCSSSTASSCNEAAINGHCWGYEKSCDDPAKRYFPPMPCPGDSRSWAATKEDQQEQFFQHVSRISFHSCAYELNSLSDLILPHRISAIVGINDIAIAFHSFLLFFLDYQSLLS